MTQRTQPGDIKVSLEPLENILSLRDQHRLEMNCQIILDSWHVRGWTDSYVLRLGGEVVGYGSVGEVRDKPKDLIVEFYVVPAHRGAALALFRAFATICEAKRIVAQTNDILLTLMLFDCAADIERDEVLFHDALATKLIIPAAVFRKLTAEDEARIFPHKLEPAGEWGVEVGGAIVATGGILFHYNPPYGDIYMEVGESFRRRGYGSYLVQELKRTCYEMGKVPAARCNATNAASRATLQKAGMLPCARMLSGVIAGESLSA